MLHRLPADQQNQLPLITDVRQSLLFEAIEEGNINLMKRLLAVFPPGFKIDTICKRGLSPLLAAAEAGQSDVVKYLYLKCGASLKDPANAIFISSVRKGKNAVARVELYRWLLQNARFRELSRHLTPAHLRAACGEWDEEIATSPALDEDGLAPKHYAQLYGYANNPRIEIIQAYQPFTFIGEASFTWILCDSATRFMQDVCKQRPDMLMHIDLNSTLHNNSLNQLPTISRLLCKAGHFEFVYDIANAQQSHLALDQKPSMFMSTPLDSLAAIIIKGAYAPHCRQCSEANCLHIPKIITGAHKLLNYILEKVSTSIPLMEIVLYKNESKLTCLYTFIAEHDLGLLEKIIVGTNEAHYANKKRGGLVNLNSLMNDQTLIYYLATRAAFKTINIILDYGNTQKIDPFERHEINGSTWTLFGLLIHAEQWTLLKRLMLQHVTWTQHNLDVEVFKNLSLEMTLISHDQFELSQEFFKLRWAAFDEEREITITKSKQINKSKEQRPTLEGLIKVEPPAPQLSPLQQLENKLKTLSAKFGIELTITETGKSIYQITLTGKQEILQPLTTLLREFKTIKGPVGIKGGMVKSELAPYKLSALLDLFNDNQKLQKGIQAITVVDKTAGKKLVQPAQNLTPKQPLPTAELTNEQKQEWIRILRSTFCFAEQVSVEWANGHFAISWTRPMTEWSVRAPKAPHDKFDRVPIEEAFIQEQIIQRIESDLTYTQDGEIISRHENSLNVRPLAPVPSSLAAIHAQVYKQCNISVLEPAPISTAYSTIFTAAAKPKTIAENISRSITAETICQLFLDITHNERSLELTCLHMKNDKWKISFAQKGMKDFFLKYFSHLQKALNNVVDGTLEIHADSAIAILRCDLTRLTCLNDNLELLQNLHEFSTAEQEIISNPTLFDQVITPSKPLSVTPSIPEVSSTLTISKARADLVRSIKQISAVNEIAKINFDYHLEQLIVLEKEYKETSPTQDKTILYYAYLLHLVRLFHLLACSAGTPGTVFHQWRNILRHALETKKDTVIFAQIHPLIVAIQTIAPTLKANTTTLGEFFITTAAPDQAIQKFLEGILPYEELLAKDALGNITKREKYVLMQKYTHLITNIQHSALNVEYKNAATLLLRSAIGALMNSKDPHRVIYREVGHHWLDVPVNDFLEALLAKLIPVEVANIKQQERPKSPAP